MQMIFSALDALVTRIIQPLLVILGLTMAILVFAGVVTRSVFSKPLFGVEELVLLSAMWLYMLGAVVASQERSHLQADFMPLLSNNPHLLACVRVLASGISLIMSIAFVLWSFELFHWSWVKQATTPVFGLPWFVSQASPFVCAVLMTLYTLRDLIIDINAARASNSSPGMS